MMNVNEIESGTYAEAVERLDNALVLMLEAIAYSVELLQEKI